MSTETIVLDTPQAIEFYRFRATMNALALELLTGMKSHRRPILALMHERGMIDEKLRGTRANKIMVLGLMVETIRATDHTWPVPSQIQRALKS